MVARLLGYSVLAVADGPAALAALRSGDRFDLLFTDVHLGRMSGIELAGAARRVQPGIRVLLASGHVGDELALHPDLGPGVHVLAKPYRRGDLDRALREALAPEKLGDRQK